MALLFMDGFENKGAYMYGLRSDRPSHTGQQCIEPKWDELYAEKKKDLDIIVKLKDSLINFIEILDPGAIFTGNNENKLAELLGTLQIDIIYRTQDLEKILKNLEKAE